MSDANKRRSNSYYFRKGESARDAEVAALKKQVGDSRLYAQDLAAQLASSQADYQDLGRLCADDGQRIAELETQLAEAKADKSVRRCGRCGEIGMSSYGISYMNESLSRIARLERELAEAKAMIARMEVIFSKIGIFKQTNRGDS